MQKVHEAEIPPCDTFKLYGQAVVQTFDNGLISPPKMTQAVLEFKRVKGSDMFTDEPMFIYDADSELKGLL